MIFLFGTGSKKIGQKQLSNTICSYCQIKDSFVATTFGTYAHFFWIPIVQISKTTVAECTHCKKTYAKKEFTEQMHKSFEKANTPN